jgi:hypothetical protein
MVIFIPSDMVKAEPVVIRGESQNYWFDTFNDTLGIYSMNHVTVNETRDDVTLEGYWNNFDNEPLGPISGWTYEYSSLYYHHNIIEDPHEPGRCLYLAHNDDMSGYSDHRLWIEFNTYYEIIDFHLTPWELKGTNRQAYFYIEFYNTTNDEIHEVRYYWDDNRSGIPASSSTLTAIGLGWPLPTGGQDFGNIKFILHENISEDIDANTFVDLSGLLVNTTKVRYGFYQDAGPNWIQIDQVHIDDLGIHPPNNTGNLTSAEVSCPSGYGWESIIVNKTEPGIDNFINITIVDGQTFEIIDGFTNISSSIINISSLNPKEHPTIRLVASLTGNGSITPILHDWKVKWLDIPPEIPQGLAISNPLNGYSLILSWIPNKEEDISDYRIEFSKDNSSFSLLAVVPVDTIIFINYGLIIGTCYYYRIAAEDLGSHCSNFSDVVSDVPDIDSDGDFIGNIEDYDDDNDGYNDTLEFAEGSDPLNPKSMPKDYDGDLDPDSIDLDDDNDGIPDVDDTFPLNEDEWLDTDGDGIGNNADIDDDNDGVLDNNDAFPLDDSESKDLDGDGIGNNTDDDIDGDGIINSVDIFPTDPKEWEDTDNDGIGDNKDIDIDDDGVININDAFPYNSEEWGDLDGDSIGDNSDPDKDGDGVPNGNDTFPTNALEWEDTDNDGLGNNADTDDDGDGYPDINDVFPYDYTEFSDLDGDGIGDNHDDDIDGDEMPNDGDEFPTNDKEWKDFDEDGIGDNSDLDDDNDEHLDINDDYPYDSSKWRRPNELLPYMYIMLILLVILIAIGVVLVIMMANSQKSKDRKLAEQTLPQKEETNFENQEGLAPPPSQESTPEKLNEIKEKQKIEKQGFPPPPPDLD